VRGGPAFGCAGARDQRALEGERLIGRRNARRWLARANPVVFTTVAGLAGFCAYFSMYAFRKPFTAATFEVVPGALRVRVPTSS